MVHSRGHWQEIPVTCSADLSTELLEFLHDMAAVFPRVSDPRKNWVEVMISAMTYLQKSPSVIQALLYTGLPCLMQKEVGRVVVHLGGWPPQNTTKEGFRMCGRQHGCLESSLRLPSPPSSLPEKIGERADFVPLVIQSDPGLQLCA